MNKIITKNYIWEALDKKYKMKVLVELRLWSELTDSSASQNFRLSLSNYLAGHNNENN